MQLGWHVVAGVVMVVTTNGSWVPITLGMVGIDLIDHGVWGAVKIRPFKIKNIWRTGTSLQKKMEAQLYFFHTFEVYLILAILSYRFFWGRWFMLAYSFHLLMDLVWYLRIRKNWNWLRKWFLCWWIQRYLT